MKLKSDRKLGKTGLTIPPVIYGTSYLGNLYRELPFEEKLDLIKGWFENTEKPVVIDTAGKYGAGLALEVIGKGLGELGVRPEDIIISNKLGWLRVPLETPEPTFEPGAWANLKNDAVQTFGYDGIMDCYKQGNYLLGSEYSVRLASVHDPDEYLLAAGDPEDRSKRKTEILESYRALFDLKKEGAVKAVGIGSKDWRIIRELYNDVAFDWVMLANSFTIYNHPGELLEFMDLLASNGVGIINSALFHGGYLTGGKMFDYQYVDPLSEKGKKLENWRTSFYRICSDFAIEPSDACIHFGMSHPAIAGIALNTSQPAKMKLNADILNKTMPEAFWRALKSESLIEPSYKYL